MLKQAIKLLFVSQTIAQVQSQAAEVIAVPQAPQVEIPVAPVAPQILPGVPTPPEANPMTPSQQKQVDHVMDQVDFDSIEKKIRDQLTKELLEKEFRQELEKEMNDHVQKIIHHFEELREEYAEQEDSADPTTMLNMKQMLKSVMDTMNTDQGIKELWKNSQDGDREQMKGLTVKFNLNTGEIGVESDGKEPDGLKPLFDWSLNTKTGDIEEITRRGNKERIVEKQVDPSTLKLEPDFFKVDLSKDTKMTTEAPVINNVTMKPEDVPLTSADQREWDNMEMQRDVAFKIMYFFIVFIIATFGLLYTYFKMSQKAEEDAMREQNIKGDPKEHKFFDFLAGQMDNEHYTVNPNARHRTTGNNQKPQFQKSINEEFGANNLEELVGGHDLQKQADFYQL